MSETDKVEGPATGFGKGRTRRTDDTNLHYIYCHCKNTVSMNLEDRVEYQRMFAQHKITNTITMKPSLNDNLTYKDSTKDANLCNNRKPLVNPRVVKKVGIR